MASTIEKKPGGTQLLKAYLFLGTSLLVTVVFLYTSRMVRKLEEQTDTLSEVFAHFCAVATIPASENKQLRDIYNEVIRRINFPVVVTDVQGRPYAWARIGISVDTVSAEETAKMNPADPPPGPLREIVEIVHELDKVNPPIPMVSPAGKGVLGYVHYGKSEIATELRWVPLVELAAVFLFMGLGYVGFRSVKVSEQRFIWVGMARETAHQLGTPISSLMGWLEVIKDLVDKAREANAPVTIERSLFNQFVDELDGDVERLEKVASRFGSIGSMPKLQLQDVVPVVAEAVQYLRTRLPKLGRELQVVENYETVPFLNINRELMEWAVENVLKNAVDATDTTGGRIEITIRRNPDQETVEIILSDNGKGMTPSEQQRALFPGFSTKKRGWGLGLTLARRIIEEYHGGRIWIRSSEPGKGTVVAMAFPV
ncbi:MAG: HAMP domain-containing sensor histidine kinase [Candidatus Eisenbacteria bacterium]|nr:HAMP domain-containing sensor histidine kinase [Candidatus Eisenbacteria bacterium]